VTSSVSSAEYNASQSGHLPAMAQVCDGVWAFPLGIPPGHMPYTLSYFLEDVRGQVHIVDPGWDSDENLHAVGEALASIGRRWQDVASVIVTHLHPDHIGLAQTIRDRHGVPVVLHHLEESAQTVLSELALDPNRVFDDLRRYGVPQERFDEVLGYATRAPRAVVHGDILVDDGVHLDVPGRHIRVLHTPGHTPGHICLHDEDNALLFTGDHVLPTVVPGIGLGGPVDYNPLERYLQGLSDLAPLDGCEVLPGHGYRFRGLVQRSGEIARQHLRRTAEVAELLNSQHPASTWDTAAHLTWTRGWNNLTRHYLTAALLQTELHVRLVRDGAHTELLARWDVTL
jgi:glyoxylase-like metal-dependent hydrolase (beta-lactamase superfamily II)